MDYTDVMHESYDRRLARLIAKELAVQKELSEPMRKTQAELRAGVSPIKHTRPTRLNKNGSTQVDKQGGTT